MTKPLREILSHIRDVRCTVFEDKLRYEIPCYFGQENALGRAIHLEVSLQPRKKAYDHSQLLEPITLEANLFKENYKTNIVVQEVISQRTQQSLSQNKKQLEVLQ